MRWPRVTFADAEQVVLGWLRAELPGEGFAVPVLPRVPDADQGRPDSFVTVRRVGGTRRSVVTDGPFLAVDAWGVSPEVAHDLAQKARMLIHDLTGRSVESVPVYRVDELAGPFQNPDPESSQPRYSATYQVSVRGS
jgi:hypothetical protein